MATSGNAVDVRGLSELVRELKGPLFRDVNHALRNRAGTIAANVVPVVEEIVSQSAAPQGPAFVKTVRVKKDRIPCVAIGAVNPKFSKSFTRKGAGPTASKSRRGAMAHGIFYGSAGGRRPKPTKAGRMGWEMDENYYKIPRNDHSILDRATEEGGSIIAKVEEEYRHAYGIILEQHGFPVRGW